MHFTPQHFDHFFTAHKLSKIAEHYFYEDTPYADVQNDVLKVAAAVVRKRKQLPINFKSPAFYGNMMSLIYKK